MHRSSNDDVVGDRPVRSRFLTVFELRYRFRNMQKSAISDNSCTLLNTGMNSPIH